MQSTAFPLLLDSRQIVSNDMPDTIAAQQWKTKGCLDPMRRNISYLKAGGAMLRHRLNATEIIQTVRSRIPTPSQASERRILNLDQWKPKLEDSVEEALSSALVAQDKELARILQEVDKITKSLKSEAPDTDPQRHASPHRALCNQAV